MRIGFIPAALLAMGLAVGPAAAAESWDQAARRVISKSAAADYLFFVHSSYLNVLDCREGREAEAKALAQNVEAYMTALYPDIDAENIRKLAAMIQVHSKIKPEAMDDAARKLCANSMHYLVRSKPLAVGATLSAGQLQCIVDPASQACVNWMTKQ